MSHVASDRAVRVVGAIAASLAVAVLAGCGGSSSPKTSTTAAPLPPKAGPVVGVMFNGPALTAATNLDAQMGLARRNGASSIRVVFNWAAAQPFASFSALPPAARSVFEDVGGVPTRFADTDRIVAAAARQGVSLLPVVVYAPVWDLTRSGSTSPLRATAPFGRFMQALIHRYGPNGSFWSSHPSLPRSPLRTWQIWNEPNFARYWSVQPFASSYVQLLATAHNAIKAADPGAQVVLAGLPQFSWTYMAQIYSIRGARNQFDIAAVHPYTARPAGVIEIMRRVRAVMDHSGDAAKPMFATEVTWPSSEGKAPPEFGVSTTEAQQSALITQLAPLLRSSERALRLTAFYWYTWLGDESPSKSPYAFNFAGLLKDVNGTITAKPALAAFRGLAQVLNH